MIEQAVLDDLVSSMMVGGAPGAILALSSPSRGLHYQCAQGLFSRQGVKPLRVDDGFRIASMSKTFTGILMMRLVEAGRLALAAPVADYLDVSAMPVAAGHRPDEVTLLQLLQHTSGLSDFAMSREWGRAVIDRPHVFREPAETLAWAFANTGAILAPGEQHEYSDTGYLALGLVIETVTGQTWGDLVRQQILEPLGMNNTWLEGYESPRSSLSHTYVGDFDGLAIHGSTDWAAGGHVSTSADLCRFLFGLFEEKLYAEAETLATMLAGVETGTGSRYGAGISTRKVAGRTLIGHNGFFGSFMAWVPELELAIAGTMNHTRADKAGFLDRLLLALAG